MVITSGMLSLSNTMSHKQVKQECGKMFIFLKLLSVFLYNYLLDALQQESY